MPLTSSSSPPLPPAHTSSSSSLSSSSHIQLDFCGDSVYLILAPGRGGRAGTPGGLVDEVFEELGRPGGGAARLDTLEEDAPPLRPDVADADEGRALAGRAGAGFGGAVLTGEGANGFVLAMVAAAACGFFFL